MYAFNTIILSMGMYELIDPSSLQFVNIMSFLGNEDG